MSRNYSQDREYNQLLSEYQRLKANLESLTECLNQRTEQWQKKQGYYDNLEKHSRMLCEEILAKDSSEMRLGSEYSWSKVDAIELIDKAIQSYGKYNKDRTDLMNKISNISEERLNMIKALEDEIIYYKQKNLGSLSETEIEEMAEKENSNNSTSNTHTQREDINYVVEEDSDFDTTDETAVKDSVHLNESYSDDKKYKTKSGRTHKKSEKRVEYEKTTTKDEVVTATKGLNELMGQIKDVGFGIINVIGQTGVSEKKGIHKLVEEELKKEISDGHITTAIKSLVGLDVLVENMVNLPVRPKFCLYTLTSTGVRIYKAKHGELPVLSEYDMIIKAHDNAEHGYGIKELLEILKNKKIYTGLTMDRKKCSIKISGVGEYIPDIVGKYNDMPVYFEYERGTHSQKDFDVKLDKILYVTKIVNIVAPNVDTAIKHINPKIENYIKRKGKVSLKNVVFRVGVMRTINNTELKLINNDDWQYIFDVNKMNL